MQARTLAGRRRAALVVSRRLRGHQCRVTGSSSSARRPSGRCTTSSTRRRSTSRATSRSSSSSSSGSGSRTGCTATRAAGVDDAWLVGTATLVGLVPFVGPLVYLLFRPPETLEDVHVRRGRDPRPRVAALRRPGRSARSAAAACEPAFLICPVCTTQLKEPCASCAAPLEPLWQACPYCAAPVGAKPRPATSTRRSPRRRSSTRRRRAAAASRAPARQAPACVTAKDAEQGFPKEPTRGFEPRTPSLRVKCSTS